MNVPLSWLREFVDIKLSAEKLAERLTMAGIEVEEIINRAKDYQQVVVGEVAEVRSHPNADKLKLASVVVKKEVKPLEIVCGASNIAVGQKVAVALLGAKLPNGLTVEPRKIRGLASPGMVCAEDELGLGSEHRGILVLDPTLKVGTPLASALGLDETVFKLAIPANRSDLFSIRGLAFEIAALTGAKFRSTRPKLPESTAPASRSISLSVDNAVLCPVYIARLIRGVHLQPSPAWLQGRLRAAGLRPVNAVVDATNAVMVEYGQPLHAFDARFVHQGRLSVRPARAGERLHGLDGKERALDSSMLVIADSRGPLAVAGVIGGEHSSVNADTTEIILESAIFQAASVRKTSRRLGWVTEASSRFEKGLPRGIQDEASRAAASLIVQLCGGRVEKGSLVAGVTTHRPTVIGLPPKLFSQLLGRSVAPATARKLLTRLGYTIRGTSQWKVTVPGWRLDVSLPEEVVDDVGRLLGYNDLPDPPLQIPFIPQPLPQLVKLKDDIRDRLAGFGFTEIISHAFYSAQSAEQVGGKHFQVANPLDQTQQQLRRSIVPQLLDVLRRRADTGNDAKVFEIGRVFLPSADTPIEQVQPWKLCLGLVFKPSAGYVHGRKLTGVLDGLFEALGVLGIVSGNALVHVNTSGFKGRVAEWCELDIATMRDNFAPFAFKPSPKFPAAYRDVSFWVPASLPFQRIYDGLVEAGKPLLESAELFDVFDQSGRRSYAFHLTFRLTDRTLTDNEISAKMKVISEALKRLGAEIR